MGRYGKQERDEEPRARIRRPLRRRRSTQSALGQEAAAASELAKRFISYW